MGIHSLGLCRNCPRSSACLVLSIRPQAAGEEQVRSNRPNEISFFGSVNLRVNKLLKPQGEDLYVVVE